MVIVMEVEVVVVVVMVVVVATVVWRLLYLMDLLCNAHTGIGGLEGIDVGKGQKGHCQLGLGRGCKTLKRPACWCWEGGWKDPGP